MEETIMVLHEIRDSLKLSEEITGGISAPGNAQAIIYQKMITLDNQNYGAVHTLQQVDIFVDNIITSEDAEINIFLSNYPINVMRDAKTTLTTAFLETTQAADDWVLYKQRLYLGQGVAPPTEFPNQVLGSSATFAFYTPQLWMTVVIFNPDTTYPIPLSLDECGISYYMAIDSKKVDSLEYGIGILREHRQYNLGVLESNGTIGLEFNSAAAIPVNTANTFASLRFGGIRPELMVSGSALSNFWIDGFSSQNPQNTLNLGQMRADLRQANSMGDWDAAFGDTTVVQDNLPDWLNYNTGLNLTGAIMSQFPALKYADNGNTLML